MGDLDLAHRIIATVRKAITIPLTVKFRSGIRHGSLSYLELGRICENEGVQAVALHPRTAKEMFRGRSDWSQIRRLKEALSIPVVGNGDVDTPGDAVRMLEETGCDGVMIGRASMKNPWIYRQTRDLLAGREPTLPSIDERRELIVEHFRLLMEQEEPKHALHKLRTFTGWYTHGLPGGKQLRARINSLHTADAFLEAIEEFFRRARVAA
jgi:nifR3 family TIM-barrel protein